MRKNVLGRTTAALLGAAAIALAAPAASASADTVSADLKSDQKLLPGQTLASGDATLVMQGDGNLVLYLVTSGGTRVGVIWSSGTWGHPGAYAYMQPDGNLVVYKQGSTTDALWSTGTWGHPGAYLSQFKGALTVQGQDHMFLWETNTRESGAVRDGGWRPQTRINSGNNLMPGQWLDSNSVWLLNQPDGNLVLYRKRDGAALWSSGTWNRGKSNLVVSDYPNYGALHLMPVNGAQAIWSVPVKGASGVYGEVQDDGNFVLYNSGHQALWSTGTWGNW
ncbi:hypothetical protein [Kitasatospora sp. NPDC004531]